ncbi:DUF5685 family protein [Mediterraneibacter sp. ICN-202921]|uniref:DUF5685 family protein n=1 Tax=Mediterraneibacter sp. ICN-202921 TaxID=3134657 RepID=UPI0030C35CE5
MFGYVTICEPELKVKDLRKYKAYYCGLCHILKEKYGISGQMTLTYDMTFAIILLTSLYESQTCTEVHRCKVHPIKKQQMLQNEITEYAADMNVLLAWYHLEDDWRDEKKVSAFLAKGALKRKAKRIIAKYPRQSQAIETSLKELAACEKENSTDLDRTAGCFGRLMEELFVWQEDMWEKSLRRMGFFLGKFIYIMDAYEDLEEDLKKKCYNPLKKLCTQEDYEEKCREILCMMIAECSVEFEKLPCIVDVDILRNILYDGVWNRYHKIQLKKREGKEKKNDEKSI